MKPNKQDQLTLYFDGDPCPSGCGGHLHNGVSDTFKSQESSFVSKRLGCSNYFITECKFQTDKFGNVTIDGKKLIKERLDNEAKDNVTYSDELSITNKKIEELVKGNTVQIRQKNDITTITPKAKYDAKRRSDVQVLSLEAEIRRLTKQLKDHK